MIFSATSSLSSFLSFFFSLGIIDWALKANYLSIYLLYFILKKCCTRNVFYFTFPRIKTSLSRNFLPQRFSSFSCHITVYRLSKAYNCRKCAQSVILSIKNVFLFSTFVWFDLLLYPRVFVRSSDCSWRTLMTTYGFL